jgi:hypothetical protein
MDMGIIQHVASVVPNTMPDFIGGSDGGQPVAGTVIARKRIS